MLRCCILSCISFHSRILLVRIGAESRQVQMLYMLTSIGTLEQLFIFSPAQHIIGHSLQSQVVSFSHLVSICSLSMQQFQLVTLLLLLLFLSWAVYCR